MTRCPDRIRDHDRILRCEAELGHDCVHYSGDLWWPNKNGLPRTGERMPWWLRMLRSWLRRKEAP